MAPTSPSMQDKGPVPAQSMSKTASKAHEKPTGGLSTLTCAQKAAHTRKANAEKVRQREQQEMGDAEGNVRK